MSTIRIVAGTGRGPTAMASYDTALADAGVHNYNLVRVSSVIPAGSTVEHSGIAPDLGPAGRKLTVVEARATVDTHSTGASGGTDTASVAGTGVEAATAGLGWATGADGRGIFYEASGADPATVRETVATGLAAGRDLREWSFDDEEVVIETTDGARSDGAAERFVTAIVLGVYGDSEPIL